MIVKTYMARPASHISDKDAAIIGPFLEDKFNGHVFTAEQVVSVAVPKRSPLHRYFTWDQAKAAQNWNVHEARMLVNSVMLVEERADGENVSTRAFHHVVELSEDGATSGYAIERIVWERDDFAGQVIERAQREFLNWKERYGQYGDLYRWAKEQLEEAA